MPKEKQIKFQIIDVRELSFSYDEIPLEKISVEKLEKNLVIGLNYALNADKKDNILKLKVRVLYKITGTDAPILKYTNEILYQIADLVNNIDIKNSIINIDDEFLAILLNISIGTIRGMIAVKTMGKIINNYPLPILNPKKIIEHTNIKKKVSSMSTKRDTYKYQYKIGNKIVHGGITNDLERREQEHQQKWPKGHIKQVGRRTTEEAARKWEEEKGY
jgi:hypothetical protein